MTDRNKVTPYLAIAIAQLLLKAILQKLKGGSKHTNILPGTHKSDAKRIELRD